MTVRESPIALPSRQHRAVRRSRQARLRPGDPRPTRMASARRAIPLPGPAPVPGVPRGSWPSTQGRGASTGGGVGHRRGTHAIVAVRVAHLPRRRQSARVPKARCSDGPVKVAEVRLAAREELVSESRLCPSASAGDHGGRRPADPAAVADADSSRLAPRLPASTWLVGGVAVAASDAPQGRRGASRDVAASWCSAGHVRSVTMPVRLRSPCCRGAGQVAPPTQIPP